MKRLKNTQVVVLIKHRHEWGVTVEIMKGNSNILLGT